MSKEIKRLLILIVSLIIISAAVIFINGKTYVITFDHYRENFELVVDKEDIVEVLDKKADGDKYYVKIRGLKEGKTTVSLANKEIGAFSSEIYVHKLGIITDNTFFGKCTGDEVIPVSISIVLVYVLYLLI